MTSSNPRVFVTQENPQVDYSDAERFGDVVFLSFREYSGIRGSLSDKETRDNIRTKLAGFNPEQDYLLFTGAPVLTGFCFHEAYKHAEKVRVLRWRSRAGKYEVVEFTEE